MTVTVLEKVYDTISEHDIALIPHNIGFTDAATINLNDQYCIYIDYSQIKSSAAAVSALMHEVGHCCTGATHAVTSKLDLVGKHEYKANKWAITHLIPKDELDWVVSSGVTDLWNLADYFCVDEPFMQKAIDYYKSQENK